MIEILREITEPSTFLENEDSIILIDELIKENILERLLNLMIQLNDSILKDEIEGIHSCLEIFENLSEIKIEIISKSTKIEKLLNFLLKRILKEEFDSLKVNFQFLFKF